MEATSPLSQKSTTGRSILAPGWVRSGLRACDWVAPQVAQRVMHRLYFRPGRLRVKPQERAVLAQGARFELEVDGVAVVGRQWGAGRTVWLVHGWGGHLGQLTPLVEPLVARGFRVIGFDWPGHGDSGGAHSSLAHAHRALGQLERFFGAPYAVVAHSFGAAATTLALGHGLAPERVVYLAPVAQLMPYVDRFVDALGLTPRMREGFLSHSERWLSAPFSAFEPLQFVSSLRTPALLLHSRDDREVSIHEAELLASHWPASKLERREGLGHRRILKDEACIAEAVNFLTA